MGILHNINKIVESFIGLEKRKSDLIDKPGYFSELTNAIIRNSGALSKRRGWRTVSSLQDTYIGLINWKGRRANTNQEDLLLVGDTFKVLKSSEETFSTVQTGENSKRFIISLMPDADGDFVFSYTIPDLGIGDTIKCGDGKGTGSVADISYKDLHDILIALSYPIQLSMELDSQSNPLARYTNTPVGLLNPFSNIIVEPNQSHTFNLLYLEDVAVGDASYNPCQNALTAYASKDPEFQATQSVVLNDVSYITTGYDNLLKYDGEKLYRAGLPVPIFSSTPLPNPDFKESWTAGNPPQTISLDFSGVSAPGVEAGTYYYMAVWRHTDAQGNIIRSTQSAVSTAVTTDHHHFIEIYVNSLPTGSGFDIENTYLELYRTTKDIPASELGAASFYKITDTPDSYLNTNPVIQDYISQFDNLETNPANNEHTVVTTSPVSKTGNVTIKYLDVFPDANIENNSFITQADYGEGRHDLPPITKHIASHQGSLVLGNSSTNTSEVFHSLPQFNTITGEIGTEYFPNNANSVITAASNGGPITGIKTLKENLYVFHENNVSLLTGDLSVTGGQFLRQDLLSSQGQIGSVSASSIQEYEGNLLFLSNEGFMSINNTSPYPSEISMPIKTLLIDPALESKNLSTSFYSAEEDIIGFYLPTVDTSYTTSLQSNMETSSVYIFNVKTKGWQVWSNVDMIGGVSKYRGNTFFISRNNNTIELNVLKYNKDDSDYSDHTSPIVFEAATSWYSAGDPIVPKKFIRAKIFVTDSNEPFEQSSFDIDLYLRKDFNLYDLGPITINVTGLGGYGVSSWGEFPWGNWIIEGFKTKLFGKAKSISLKFKNDKLNQNILVSGYSMEIAGTYKPEIKE